MPATYPALPALSDEELSQHFADDSDAIRRYRLLHAVLVAGLPQREAALAHQVSERTVRNVLQLYRRSGSLESLRTRRPAGHQSLLLQRQPYEAAMAAALHEEPLAGGDTLWRRARQSLGEAGSGLSRRTAYRILARLRSETRRADEPGTLFGLVRAALPALLEDPPIGLGGSALARRLLPDEEQPLRRGALLQQALHTAIERLRPADTVAALDRAWWPYLICSGEYEAGRLRADLQRALALSASTYSRAKRQGLTQITHMLPQIIAPLVESPAVIAGERLPRTCDFVGRYKEQCYYAWRLQTEGMAELWGLPGCGKTALAAEIAAESRRYGQTILWHTCRPGRDSGLLGMTERLAQALAGTGDQRLWRALRPANTPQDPASLVELLCEQLQARPTVLIIDDVQRAAAESAPLLVALRDLAQRGGVRLLLAGRRQPLQGEWPPLAGLAAHEAPLLWGGLPPLPDEQWHALYAASAGLPRPIRRIAATYRRAGLLARLDDWKAELVAWADDEIWARLSDHEQRLLTAAHAFAGRPWAGHALLVLAALGINRHAFTKVLQHGLITTTGPLVELHPALQLCAAARLREDTPLRTLINALAATIAETAPLLDNLATPAILEPGPAPAQRAIAQPSGLELLAWVRQALARTSAYIERNGDETARRLVAELTQLQAALPDPCARYTPPPRPLMS